MRDTSAESSTAVATVNDTYSDIDIARSLPTYGPAATAGYSVLTGGFIAFGGEHPEPLPELFSWSSYAPASALTPGGLAASCDVM